ncbi:MAG TPA: methionine synthase [Bryobacteraceae bacterium]|nr:methionine synthase [Bryobacteraceae bacterium]
MNALLDQLRQHVLLCDGAMGTRVQAANLDVVRDYDGHENCTDIVTRKHPDVIREIHISYLEAGADILKTNTFGASPVTLGEFGLAAEAYSLNVEAARLAREAIEQVPRTRPRFVLGGVGPGTKLPSLGHIEYHRIEDALTEQCRGLLDGGVDGILFETCQDPLQIKAGVNGARRAAAQTGRTVPVFVQFTVETSGTLLVGTDIAAAATIVEALGVDSLGLNCATGPAQMVEHVKWLGENWPGFISVQPNAGLPEMHEGRVCYRLTPAELAAYMECFVVRDGVHMIGGCCGTTQDHIRALDQMLRRHGPERPVPLARSVVWIPAIASLYSQVPLRQESAYFSIGERCNANGSRAFRERQAKGDWDGCVALGVDQVKEGAHALDVCTAFVGRQESAEMAEVVTRMRGQVNAPLVIDSTELGVIESALSLYGGKAIINSINFEDGEAPAAARLRLARKFGAAVVALTIDETGMAKSTSRKVEMARRLYDFAVNQHGLPSSDLLLDPLTFTICTGNEEDRELGLATLDAIEQIRGALPECQVILGLSNISFGLNPLARQVLNSVFLDHALRRGMTGAILHHSKILPLSKIAPNELEAAENLIYARHRHGFDPLQNFLACFEGRTSKQLVAMDESAPVEQRLAQRIVDGNKAGLTEDLDEALLKYAPLEIINQFLLDGMKTVGDLFGAGKMQLPFVLQAAEVMKAAVTYLEPKMDRECGDNKGTIVLATVKGNVHDIGKNLVDILLTNNGYRVINLGIKQPLTNILDAASEHNANAIGMSGLLVKSTAIMKENLEEMTRKDLSIPVIVGGAALTRDYVGDACVPAYGCGRVAYASSAFEGLRLMGKITSGQFDGYLEAAAQQQRERAAKRAALARPAATVSPKEIRRDVPIPQPPFWGARLLEWLPAEAILRYLNRTMLFRFHWGFRGGERSAEEMREWERQEGERMLNELLARCREESILSLTAAYGFWPACGDEDDVVVLGPPGSPDEDRELWRFTLPRQTNGGGACIADFLRPISEPERDVIALQVVTSGQRVADVAREWFEAGSYKDYVFLHGLGVELTEALAEHVHARIRHELGFGHVDDPDPEKMLKQGYRGSRYSFGYPACPDLSQQRRLLELLDAGRCGITMSEEDQLWPEQSTSAIVLHHPEARYFSAN